ncbi:MAG: DUF4112 domain-containing protein [Deltaproteobacteria bacterium]|nr:DUF4112 domain-containing protein [Deltaproteobacteria bacterium]
MADLAIPASGPSSLARTARELEDVDPLAARLAHWLDTAFRVPGTSIRFGLDGLLGMLAPGLGDVATGSLSAYLFFVALRRRVPLAVIGRMALNVAVDVMVGTVPILGDVFDFAWKANVKNLELIRKHADRAAPPSAIDHVLVLGLAALVVASLAAPFVLAMLLGWGLFGQLAR